MEYAINVKLGIAPIAWSNDDLPELGGETPLTTFLRDAKEIGFDGVELGNKFPKDKKALKKILNDYELELVGGWFSGNLLTNSLAEEKRVLLQEIERRVYCNSHNIVYAECSNTIQGKPLGLSHKPILKEDEIKQYAEKYSLLHEFAKNKGVILAYHHHIGTIFQTAKEVDLFLQYGSKDIGITFDTGHYYFAGEEPFRELKKHRDRIYHIHLKDVRDAVKKEMIKQDKSFLEAVLAGVYTVPGDGVINFTEIINFLKATQYEGWIVIEAEQDPKRADPYTYSKMAFNTISDLLKK
ncbi:myo-inosose-2 dehydratase [Helicobacter apodemus]|uniref:Myo-inosose-2 dehydratase n=1 Tax=Helicobacter apodemus TaxID=135569 RepID=A0A4U8UHL5_9HELI|nr:myo-inosose-2 dehydratase [Helicobacter apodemus]MDE6958716.1 myo-inosose-2 dehydratase [Helicobacter apodemus]TLE16546.1 myo-inosose-2 dehydratase [Helicobacter apodemus]